MNFAIIVAAGSGRRFGSEVPKQFLEIGGKPLLIHTLEKFEKCAAVDEIVLILSPNEVDNFRRTLEKFSFKKSIAIVAGGETRAESVRCGLNAIDAEKCEIIAVHDGARPLVTVEEIAATIAKAREIGAACLVAKVTDTIKETRDGKIVGTIDRENLRRALTPQAFRRNILQAAFAPENFDAAATDECFLVEKIGVEIAFVDGAAKNIKITTPEDFEAAKIWLNEMMSDQSVIENV
ncbi:MAG: 2-C-methyl-D-erythritol 4-phosphate cytidylyltransferase [Acidobacteriota bacterium]|nr:2-C-methyl-D-erythritol 4-phosphate cytidylyltransferase [Acidobacteriota bacterium]